MIFLILAVLVICTSAATVWTAGIRSHEDQDPDATFWYVFTGVCALGPMILGPMILIPAATNKTISLILLALAAVSAVAARRYLHHRRTVATVRQQRASTAADMEELTRLHQVLLRRWSRYELDPAATIDFPAMSDVRVPETSALIRAVSAAARLRPQTEMDDGVTEYRCAVTELAVALETAERAAHATPTG